MGYTQTYIQEDPYGFVLTSEEAWRSIQIKCVINKYMDGWRDGSVDGWLADWHIDYQHLSYQLRDHMEITS